MLRNFLIIVMLAFMILPACNNSGNDEKSPADDTTKIAGEKDETDAAEMSESGELRFRELNFVEAELGKVQKLEGKVEFGRKWQDKNGYNLLVFTRDQSFKQWPDAEADDMGDYTGYLKAYHFAEQEGSMELVRLIKDFTQPCSSPPFLLEYDFYKESVNITDLDNDGYGEVTFMYYMNCASEINPRITKLMMLENGEKYAIRGDQYVMPYYPKSGKKEFDPAFNNAPDIFRTYAGNLWEEFCKSNPDQAATKADAKFFTADRIKKISFSGTEPFWSMQLREDRAERRMMDGSLVRLDYVKGNVAHNIKLSQIIEHKDANTVNIKVTDESGGALGIITIEKKNCSDGMSENVYPYTFKLTWEDGGGWSGCGRDIDLSQSLSNYENMLAERIAELKKTRKSKTGLFYENNIRNFEFYKDNDDFRSFVDGLLDMGYTIKQQEGRYYLYE